MKNLVQILINRFNCWVIFNDKLHQIYLNYLLAIGLLFQIEFGMSKHFRLMLDAIVIK